jgi:hypothetical protein
VDDGSSRVVPQHGGTVGVRCAVPGRTPGYLDRAPGGNPSRTKNGWQLWLVVAFNGIFFYSAAQTNGADRAELRLVVLFGTAAFLCRSVSRCPAGLPAPVAPAIWRCAASRIQLRNPCDNSARPEGGGAPKARASSSGSHAKTPVQGTERHAKGAGAETARPLTTRGTVQMPA